MARSEGVQALQRGLALLDTMAGGEAGGATLSELALRTGLSPSTVHRLLKTLVKDGYALRDPDSGRYVPGHRIVGIAASIGRRTAYLRSLARPHLQKIAAATGETTNLVVLDDVRSVYVDQVQGARAVTMSIRVGSIFPAYTSASAKAILAYQPDERGIELIFADEPLQRLGPRTITTSSAFRDELAGVRRRGYALEREELEAGVGCIAGPIRGQGGQAIAAISVPGPVQRIFGRDSPRLGALVLRHTAEISRALGFRLRSRAPADHR